MFAERRDMKKFELTLQSAFDVQKCRDLQRLDVRLANDQGKFDCLIGVTVFQQQTKAELAMAFRELANSLDGFGDGPTN